MWPEKFRWLAGVIAAFPNHHVVGRTRLQKTVKLLQRLRFPTDYGYTIHFYGPYSEGVQADIGLLEKLGLVREEAVPKQDGETYYKLRATEAAALPEVARFKPQIDIMANADPVVLELAATYDMFRETGSDHAEALERLRRKKGTKCAEGREQQALALLHQLGLPAA